MAGLQKWSLLLSFVFILLFIFVFLLQHYYLHLHTFCALVSIYYFNFATKPICSIYNSMNFMYHAPTCLVTFFAASDNFVHFYSDEHNYALCRFLYCTACTTYQMFHVFQLRIQVLTCATMPESCARILSNVLNMLFFFLQF